MKCELCLCLVVVAAAGAQVYFPSSLPSALSPPPLGGQGFLYQQEVQQPERRELAHREVVANAQLEAQLPPHLMNPFYKNPRIAEALAKESWFGPGEMHVSHRETEKIPRERIFSVLKNAGLARRRRR